MWNKCDEYETMKLVCVNKHMWQIITNEQTKTFLAVKTGVVKMILYIMKWNERKITCFRSTSFGNAYFCYTLLV